MQARLIIRIVQIVVFGGMTEEHKREKRMKRKEKEGERERNERETRNPNSQQFGLLWHLMRFILVSNGIIHTCLYCLQQLFFSLRLTLSLSLCRYVCLSFLGSYGHSRTFAHMRIYSAKHTKELLTSSKLWTVLSWFGTFTLVLRLYGL